MTVSKRFQPAIYTVLHEESESEVQNIQIFQENPNNSISKFQYLILLTRSGGYVYIYIYIYIYYYVWKTKYLYKKIRRKVAQGRARNYLNLAQGRARTRKVRKVAQGT